MSSEHSQHPLVSVLVPSYKHERYVAAALQSVFDQDYPNLELIVVDDVSPDDTAGAIARWAAHPRIGRRFARFVFLVNERNLGAHSTINLACGMAAGDYIAVLNSDDYFHPARIGRLVGQLRDRSLHFAFSRVVPVDDAGRAVSPAAVPGQLVGAFEAADRAVAEFGGVSEGLLSGNLVISTGNFVFSRELYASVGPFVDLKYVHDWDFALRATLAAEPVYVPEDLYFYRVHASNSFAALAGVADIESRIALARYAKAKGARAYRGLRPENGAIAGRAP